MSVRQTLVVIVLLATSSVVFAQNAETKPPDVGNSGAKALDQVEILTDTMGVDFGPYLTRIVQIVKQNWYNLMPPQVYPPIKKQGKVSLEFSILKDGKVNGMTVHASSGDVALDRAAWASITASTPFPPLPTEFHGQFIGLRFYYYYNLRPGDSLSSANRDLPDLHMYVPGSSRICHFDLSTISISPCVDVRG